MTHITSDSTGDSRTTAPRVVIAPDAFDGAASAEQCASWLADGVRSIIPDADIVLCPMSNGGEATSVLFAGERISLPTTDAAGRLTEVSYTYDASAATAYIDAAAASGASTISGTSVHMTGDTFGTGVLIADAQTRGARRIVISLGGCATVDGATGILVALGANPLNAAGYPLAPGGAGLVDLADFDIARLNIAAASVDWVLLADTAAPATGKDGIVHTFDSQRGVSEDEVELLERAITQLCEITQIDGDQPGYGAGGAIPVGLHWVSRMLHGNSEHFQVVEGARVVAQANNLANNIAGASLIITGQTQLDPQRMVGTVVSTVCELAAHTDAIVAVAADTPNEAAFEEVDAQMRNSIIRTHLEQLPDIHDRLIHAGAEIAERYVKISTTQG